tara:strand:+ start:6039 stop:6650 length:612 start_codon:yes stop_codon:yes gene_type:complete
VNKKKILLVGAGSHAFSCIDVIEQNSEYEIAGFIEKSKEIKFNFNYPILGTDEDLENLSNKFKYAFISIGQIKNPEPRIISYKLLKKFKYILPFFISKNSYFSKENDIGESTIVMHGCVINKFVKIGNNCIINSKVLIEHNSIIGNSNHISTGAIINGNVSLGNNNFVGSGTIIYNNVKIGNNCIIGAGSIIKKDVNDNCIIK